MNLRWPQYLKQLMVAPKWLAHFSQRMTAEKSLAEQLNSIMPTEQIIFIQQFIEDTVKTILGLSKGQTIDEQKGFFDMGMDSLMVVEFRNRLQAGLGQAVRLGTTAVFDHASINKMTRYLCQLLNIEIENEATEVESLDEKIEKQSSQEVEKLGDQEVLDELYKAIDDEEK